MAKQLQQIREVLDGLTRSQEQNQWARNVKGPEVFKADTRESELKQWEDWTERCEKGEELEALRSAGFVSARPGTQAHQAHAGRERLRGMEAAAERHAAEYHRSS